ncbi:MAG TPA: hypothetical protein VL048_04890 [Xanthobacteraceae bacterium]|nr:hypothetical protein [Xanthobacteraceae bacterium]
MKALKIKVEFRKLASLAVAMCVLLSSPASAVDMSCNGLQHTQLLSLINRSTILSGGDRARYQAQADYFLSEMGAIRNAAKGVDGRIESAEQKKLKELFGNVSRETIIKMLDADKTLMQKYESQLYHSASYLEDLSRDQNSQIEAHRLENLQMMVRSSIPMEVAERDLEQMRLSNRYVQVVAHDRNQQEALQRAATDMPALRTLFAAAALADRISQGDTSFRRLQSISGQSQGVFDDKVVAEGFEQFGRAASRIASVRLQATLDFEQAVKVPQNPDLRQEIMTDVDSPIAPGNAKVTGRVLQVFHETQLAVDTLVKAVPEPLKVTSSSQPSQSQQEARVWMHKAGEQIKQAVRKMDEQWTHE